MKHPLARLTLCLLPLGAAADALANDFPTVDRVLYVHECMDAHPGPHFEMVNKCACALDALASKLSFDDYVEMSTAAKATSISGERGGYIRDSEGLQDQIKRYRGIKAEAEKGCFLSPATR
ncbi:hypothetical protein [Ideonella sp.]|uniref:hypothetical protein n=1 Tax=Ideonella sp. TaxID=1929293 RepID=UPI002B488A60|nr:hypothetical protein [Ideonella sp.]HJV72099.1 hypothetical protein [Ideonella sp.]